MCCRLGDAERRVTELMEQAKQATVAIDRLTKGVLCVCVCAVLLTDCVAERDTQNKELSQLRADRERAEKERSTLSDTCREQGETIQKLTNGAVVR